MVFLGHCAVEYMTQTRVVELEGRWCVAGEAACCEEAGKRREEEHNEVGMAGGKQCQSIGQCPEDKGRGGMAWFWEQGTAKDLGGLVGWLEQSVRPGLGRSPACTANVPT